ncbi:hypothetical protein [Georgenia sp. SUBG003]|uniref:hypothetical protein n=1 Tax=Georgenia sp. SUBG003 TaxID=1497974 RepID=UPI003AB6E9BC
MVFTLTVEGFDDVTADLFDTVRDLAPYGSVVIAVNKSGSELAENRPGVLTNLRRVVPDIADFPLVWTDAHQWAEAAATNKQWLRDQSNVGRLAALLTDLAVQNEAALHMRRRLQPLLRPGAPSRPGTSW